MRVAHVIWGRCNPESANGVDKAVYYLSKHQAALGAQVAVFSFTSKEPIPIPGVQVEILPPPRDGRIWSKLPYISSTTIQKLLAWQPDVVHFHSVHIGPFIALGRALGKRRIPYVVTPHGALAPGRLRRVGYGVHVYLRLWEKAYLEQARFVHAISKHDRDGMRMLGIKTPIVVIPNGIDLAAIPQAINKDITSKWPWPFHNKRTFLFLGRLDPQHKGLDLLFHGFALAQLSQSMLVLVGPDWRGSEVRLRNLAKKLGIENQVFFSGPAFGEEKWKLLAGADVFVHLSRWEGLSISVLEALAMRKPVLVSRAADPGGIEDARAGVVVDLDITNVVEALRMLSVLPRESLREMGRNGRILVETKYNWENIASRLLEAYDG